MIQRAQRTVGWSVSRRLAQLAIAMLAFSSLACGDGDKLPRKSAGKPKTEAVKLSIKANWVSGDKRYPVSFAPATPRVPPAVERSEDARDGKNQGEAKSKLQAPGQRSQSIQKCATPESCTDIDVESVDGSLRTFDGEMLLMTIADSCISEQREPYDWGGNGLIASWSSFTVDLQNAVTNPTSANLAALPRVWDDRPGHRSWLVFQSPDENVQVAATLGCDQVLARQESLLCVANRLSEIADAVTTTQLPATSGGFWEFPVQDIKDKFILRDLAVASLGHIALLETELPSTPPAGAAAYFDSPRPLRSCSDVYVKAMGISALNVETSNLFKYASWNTPGWLPLPQMVDSGDPPRTLAKAKELVAMRGSYKANIYRASGRLLRDLIDKSVQADLAGAERRRADAGDPVLGLQLMWGADADDEASQYNSMRHAFRTLFGRLDWMNPNPNSDQGGDCFGPSAIEDGQKVPVNGLIETLGDGFSARWMDRPPQTSSQSLALSLATQSGVVLPTLDLTDAEVQAVVREQLLRKAAVDRGLSVEDFASTPGAQAINAAVAKVPVADLRFGLQSNIYAYRQLADVSAFSSLPGSAPAGLTFDAGADTGATVVAKGGKAIKGGIPRVDLHVDMANLLGRAQVAAQCASTDSTTAALHPLQAGHLELESALQSPFVLAHLLQVRLQHLANSFDSLPTTSTTADVVKSASAGATELRTWAGPGLMVARAYKNDETDTTVKGVNLFVLGLKPEDIGAKDLASMGSRLAVVRGEPWKADCVAGIRGAQACPVNRASLEAEASTVVSVAVPECADLSATVDLGGSLGNVPTCDLSYVGSIVRIDVDLTSPVPVGEDGVIRLVERPNGPSPGRVLGAVAVTKTYSGPMYYDRIEVISDYQRELVNQAFGSGSPAHRKSTCGDVTTTAIPDNYCLAGLERDMFVPLSNELTADGEAQEDSWKHYLKLAEDAAAHADELGNQLILAGKAKDLRREGAQEGLAGICGTYANVDAIGVRGGLVSLDAADESLKACIQPTPVDVVFLTKDPWESSSPADATAGIREAYCNDQVQKKPRFCSKDGILTHGALGFPTYVPPTPPTTCDAAFALAKDVSSGLGSDKLEDVKSKLSALSTASFVSRGGLFAGFGGLQLTVLPKVDSNGEILWEGKRYGKLLLAPATSESLTGLSAEQLAEVYPACVTAGCTGTAEDLRQIFSPNGGLDHTTIRHRIEAALFQLGAIAGNVPEETFTVPVPVYLASADGNPTDVNDLAMGPAIYSYATFDQGDDPEFGPYYTLKVEPNHPVRNAEESLALGRAYPAPAGYWAKRLAEDSARSYAPAWRKSLYEAATDPATAGAYATVQGKSPGLFFNKLMQGRSLLTRQDNVQQWVRDFASALGTECTNWPGVDLVLRRLSGLNDLGTPATWSTGASSDTVQPADQRNVCHSLAHPVFYEDLGSRKLHLRTHAWHAAAGPKSFKEIIEDIDDPSNAMHGEMAGFFEPFAKCSRQLQDPALINEQCIRWNSYTEGPQTLLDGRALAYETNGYQVPLGGISGDGNFRGAVENRLQPTTCSAGDRAEFFIDRYADTSCDMATSVVDALALACLIGQQPVKLGLNEGPPGISTLDDLPRFEAWLEKTEVDLGNALNDGFFEELPARVLERHLGETAFTSGLGSGNQGDSLLKLASQIEALHASWTSMTGAIRDFRSTVRSFRLELVSLDNQNKLRQLQEKQEKLRLTQEVVANTIRAAAEAAAAAFSLDSSGASHAGEAAAAYSNAFFAKKQLAVLDDKKIVGEQENENAKERTSESFNTSIEHTFGTLDLALVGIRTAANGTLQALNEIGSNSRQASWELAKATGGDFAVVDGQRVPLHLNTVLNREYNVLRLRYERALDAAKRAAYLARLSMEQRLGVRLVDLREPVGPLPPPASWVENLCSVQGVDYEKLRTAGDTSSANEGAGAPVVQEFANQYVGDYVAQLREFIEFYNIEFPFRQADDNAVLSLREQLLVPDAQCNGESANELFYSDALYKTGQLTVDNSGVKGGWSNPTCIEDSCMYVKDGKLLKSGTDETDPSISPPDGVGAVSWLYVTDDVPDINPGADYSGALGQPLPEDAAPFGAVYQTVQLRAGRVYVLSWWDMARAMDGTPLTAADDPQVYFVGVYDKNWQLVALANPVASDGVKAASMEGGSPELGVAWSARRRLDFTAFDDGDYHIAFAAAELGARPASLAIANVQLEQPDKNLTNSSAYQHTGGTLTVLNAKCKAVTKEQLRASFVRRCEGGRNDASGLAERCYYELQRDILIDSELHSLGFGGLVGQISQDNYNTRHVSFAMNLVGTGLLDCSNANSEACYGSAFVEYDLEHIAFNAPIVNYDQETHCFNFGKGSIKGGKALASERYITLPLSSDDQALLAQPAFRKTELFGRPLSGLYKLRIRDNPALVWDNLEDVQFVMDHRYWSRVGRP